MLTLRYLVLLTNAKMYLSSFFIFVYNEVSCSFVTVSEMVMCMIMSQYNAPYYTVIMLSQSLWNSQLLSSAVSPP